ncbi:MAG: sensor histidine kinase [Polyangiales bacterium]
MSTRKTPLGAPEEDDRATGPRTISDAPIDVLPSEGSEWPTLPSDVAPTRRRVGPTDPPAVIALGQEELLRLAVELPVEEGSEAVMRVVCEAVRDVIAPAAVGVRFIQAGQLRVVVARSAEVRDAEVVREVDLGGPPRRMFPSLCDEWIVPLPTPFDGFSMHLADGRPSTDPMRSRSLAELAERSALLLATGLRAAMRLETARVDGAHLRALQARVIQSEKLASVGQIAAKVVHELNNPLTAIVTYSAFLTKKLERANHDEGDVERLRRIGESADRILRFSRELMTYARPNEETPGLVAVHEVMERAVLFCEHIIAELGIEVSTTLDPSTPPVVGRRGQLTQVFVNLVTNACHAIQDAGRTEGGRIEISSTGLDEGGVRIMVGDNGKGISPENVIRIFDPFFTTKAEGRGTGLGLSIVRSIVEGHGGRVWVRSVVGSGTTFVVELRRRPEER